MFLKKESEVIFKYARVFLKWILISVVVGGVCGFLGGLFHKCIETVTEIRIENFWLIYLLPAGGVVIVFLYRLCKKWGKLDTNRVLMSANGETNVPLVLSPLIFIGTVLTHLFGGSAGREGAALQLGGSLGYNIGKVFRFGSDDLKIIVMGGMSGVFSALFGTPLTAAFFALEVACVGVMRYSALLPCLLISTTAFLLSGNMGNLPVSFELSVAPEVSVGLLAKVLLLAAACGLLSIVFCGALSKGKLFLNRTIKNDYLRIVFCGVVIILLTVIVGNQDYNGAGVPVISEAMNGNASVWAFLLKIVFTVITMACGYKGGEIVPAFFVGATFGCVFGDCLGIDPGFAAAIGFVSVFCGVVNCPVASVFLALEVFGGKSILFFAIACGVSFFVSGNFGLYKSQKIAFSKLDGTQVS